MCAASRDAPVLVLASRSPRRGQLLRQAGVAFEQVASPFDDAGMIDAMPGRDAQGLAMELALRKARALARTLDGRHVVLGADTLCVGDDGSPRGQPTSRDAAEAMLRGFIGKAHDVVTGVALVRGGDGEVLASFADTATVRWGDVDAAWLEAYLDSGDWRGKAGGYNLYERQTAGWPIDVAGDPTTVVGLPMRRLEPVLASVCV